MRYKLHQPADAGGSGSELPPSWHAAFENAEQFANSARRFRHSAWQHFSAGNLIGVLKVFEAYSAASGELGQHAEYALEYERGLIHIGSLIVELLFVEDKNEDIYRHGATLFRMLDSVLNLPPGAGWDHYMQAYQCIGWAIKEIACVKIYDSDKNRDRVIKPEGILVLFHEAGARYFMLETAAQDGKQVRSVDLLHAKELFIWMFMPVVAMAFRHCSERHARCVELYNSVAGDVLAAEPLHFRTSSPPRDANHMYWWHQKIISALAGGLTMDERRRCTEEMLRRENWLRKPTTHDLAYVAAHDRRIDSIILRQSGLELV